MLLNFWENIKHVVIKQASIDNDLFHLWRENRGGGGGERERDLSVKLERSARSRSGKDGEGVKNSGLATGNEYNITC